jgi:phosphatidylserine/phosphatidylglycerophosphate/cardiolipin synthase-like enzyme
MVRRIAMFRLKKSSSSQDLLTSTLYSESSFYPAFIRDLKRCKKEVIIESPYITTRRVDILEPIFRKLVWRGVKVTVNTRYPGHHDELLRIQAWQGGARLTLMGVKVKYFNDYRHSKVAVIDSKILYEGSLNILSQCNSREVMRRIESEELTQQMIRFLRLKRFYW